MIRRAKALVQEKGILSTPNRKAGKTLLEKTARLVQEFYEKDELSRMMRGKKDCVTMKIDGVKQKVQKRLLLCNLGLQTIFFWIGGTFPSTVPAFLQRRDEQVKALVFLLAIYSASFLLLHPLSWLSHLNTFLIQYFFS